VKAVPQPRPKKNFKQLFVNVCQKAIDSYKTDWEGKKISGFKISDRVIVGNEKQPMSLTCAFRWSDTKAIEASNAKLHAAMPQMMNEQMVQDGEQFGKKMEKIAAEMGAAAEAGDFEKMKELQLVAEKMGKEQEKVFSAHENSFYQKVGELTAKDAYLEVRFLANNFGFDITNAKSGKLATGQFFYRTGNGEMQGEKWVEGTTIVPLGKGWQKDTDEDYTSFSLTYPDNFKHTRAYSLVIKVEGEQKRANEFLESLPWSEFEKLFK
jgi:hypothetical protein